MPSTIPGLSLSLSIEETHDLLVDLEATASCLHDLLGIEAGRSSATPDMLVALYDQSRLLKHRAGLTDADEEQAIFEQAQERAEAWLRSDAEELGRSLVGRLLFGGAVAQGSADAGW